MAQLVLEVPEISCEHCERTIKETLEPLDGVEAVRVHIPAKSVTVDCDYGTITVGRMSEALAAEEYPVAASRPA